MMPKRGGGGALVAGTALPIPPPCTPQGANTLPLGIAVEVEAIIKVRPL